MNSMNASMSISDLDVQTQDTRAQPVMRLRDGQLQQAQDQIAQEVAVAFVFNGIAFAVMMASPSDLHDFAYGFAYSEGIIDHATQIYDCEAKQEAQGYTIDITIAGACFARLKDKKRQLAGRTGCGLCGVESLEQAIRQPAAIQSEIRFSAPAISSACTAMRTQQNLLDATGSSHAAAWCHADGRVAVIREDIGRHNALDKVIGACLRQGLNMPLGFVCVTSRASYEMVQKTANAGIPLLAAISGVTSLAIDIAQQAGLCLLGFTRGQDFSVYCHSQRLHFTTT
ncbi:formate dehydrogenase accessory sulfurtransferase FdhD [Undibacterium fentianense]|nr:formate dehydrogenase accessory sulfurtransferase FdhD [Undibacterium fentianense]